MTDFDVVVIGAGAAGLGAATALREAGRRAVVLEAQGRIGGRAWTAYPAELGGVWFDMGAVWLHAAERNPLVPIAEAAGDKLLRADELRCKRTFVGTRPATPAEMAEYGDAWERFDAAADRLTRPDMADLPLAAVARNLPNDPWALTVEAWEGSVICAADAEAFSLLYWKRNLLSGSNLVPEGGIGAFIERRLGIGLDIWRNTPATAVRWGGPGGRVEVETPRGAVTAGACIVTTSTGALAAGAIRFDPPLPERTRTALHALPMGLAMKVALRATGPDRLGLPAHCSLDRRVERSGEPFMVFQCWPFHRDYIQGWVGGTPAWELAKTGDAAAADFALGELRRILGGNVDRVLAVERRFATHWDADPWVRGAYAYARPGCADTGAALGEPLADGHLIFAGEACHDGFAGTLGGAWLNGQAAARAAARAVGP